MKRAAQQEVAPLLDEQSIGLEARSVHDDHHSLRLWLRLLACSTDIETEIRKRLRASHGMTLARFDYLAQLHRYRDGLSMRALSRYLMVTGGNVTGLASQLVDEGLIERLAIPGDRRAHAVRLTAKGKRTFDLMAGEHERWVIGMLAGLPAAERARLFALLGTLKARLQSAGAAERDP
jgi:DNA-binding MarR family transcriptional regulator